MALLKAERIIINALWLTWAQSYYSMGLSIRPWQEGSTAPKAAKWDFILVQKAEGRFRPDFKIKAHHLMGWASEISCPTRAGPAFGPLICNIYSINKCVWMCPTSIIYMICTNLLNFIYILNKDIFNLHTYSISCEQTCPFNSIIFNVFQFNVNKQTHLTELLFCTTI